MQPSTVRQLWSLVERTKSITLLQLSDKDLVEQLFRQLSTSEQLTNEENNCLITYIYSRLTLIRDLAEARSM